MFTAGPDGIRGSTPYHIVELKALTIPQVWPIPVKAYFSNSIFEARIPYRIAHM
jgi:hypothetical protein